MAAPVGQHEAVSERKTPVDHAVELAVYAPIGLVSEARRLLPSFVDKGRARVDMYKMVGQFAVKQGRRSAKKRLADTQDQVESILGEFGLGSNGQMPAAEPRPAAAPASAEPEAVSEAPAAPRASAAAHELPLADYDSLAASQVIPRLIGLDADELEAVRAYESAHRGRKTILGKLAQLQSS